jgi:hypothetical protein
MKKYPTRLMNLALAIGQSALSLAAQSFGGHGQDCPSLPGYAALQRVIAQATAAETSGSNNQMWATIVNRDRCGLRCCFFRRESRRPVAGKPGYLGAEGEHRET